MLFAAFYRSIFLLLFLGIAGNPAKAQDRAKGKMPPRVPPQGNPAQKKVQAPPKPRNRPASPWLLKEDVAVVIEVLKKDPRPDVRAEATLVLALAANDKDLVVQRAILGAMRDENGFVRASASWAVIGEFWESQAYLPFCPREWGDDGGCFTALASAVDKALIERAVVLWEFSRQDARTAKSQNKPTAKHLARLLNSDVRKGLITGMRDPIVGVRHQSILVLSQVSELIRAIQGSKAAVEKLGADAQTTAKEILLQLKTALDSVYRPELTELLKGAKHTRDDEFNLESEILFVEKVIRRTEQALALKL